MYFWSRRTHERSGKPPESSLLLLKNANFTLSDVTRTVASLLPVCLWTFGCSLLVKIQSDVPGDMSWSKMTGWVGTVDNEGKAHMHTGRAPVRLRDSVRSLLPSREAAGRVDLLFFSSKNACRSKFKQLWKHMRDLRSVRKPSVVYLTALNVCSWEKNI